jgi:AcrR family transcriptional regulator
MSPRTDVGPKSAKPLRRDAELNLARILLAARDVFAEHGYQASMEQIAARAEVGIGTLYRRFPNKADLYAAVVDAATCESRSNVVQLVCNLYQCNVLRLRSRY